MDFKFPKLPKRTLFLSYQSNVYKPNCSLNIDYEPKKGIIYDLIVYVEWKFRMNIKYPECVSDAEIYFVRGESITEKIFLDALKHYNGADIRKGK
ncbi:hypothetical protein A0H76_649 [Hepatospora eriocheir]|uniref:Uncharacterized protein n=1 Tax=Hepatospora eriocheir TaxID=1081669 RepID=A0A1X0Q7D9_9MICR|nr:hypothetical protein A0H76_649 [Hepatospora eriocheir]